jgi:hypothetical protein
MHFSELLFYQEEISFLTKLIIINNNDCLSLSAVLHHKIVIVQFLYNQQLSCIHRRFLLRHSCNSCYIFIYIHPFV